MAEINTEEITDSYITMPKGFKASGVSCGLKGNGIPDLALILSDTDCSVAGVYTSNLVKGHSLVRSINLINEHKPLRGIVINSKNANACVGPIGIEDAQKVAQAVADRAGCDSSAILTASTGVIGERLPFETLISGVPALFEELSDAPESAHKAERAIMTTDTVPKEVSATLSLKDNKTITIAAMAKGSGMIHPNLATMISVFTTDANIDSKLLDTLLHNAVAHTFNRVSVDGDTSVCDMVTIFSNGASGVTIEEGSEDAKVVSQALEALSFDLSKMIASDGEGATKLVEIEVFGAKNPNDAKLIVSSVAKSPLCKTAFFGEDANLGRVITACGYSGATFDPEKIDISLSGLETYKNGCAVDFDEEEASRLLAMHEINITITLHEGDSYDRMFTCDFSYDYVKINGSYRT